MKTLTKTGGREATAAVVPGRGLLSIGDPRTPAPDGYKWIALAEVARMESGHTPSRSKPEYWNEGIPWIGIKDATGNDGQVIQGTLQSISPLGVDNSSTRLLPAGTVCLSRTASVGYVVQMGVPMCTSQDFVNWVCGPVLNPNYLRYLLLAEAESVRSWATGSTHKTLYFPEAKALHALLPSTGVQDGVVEVLGAIDDKIAANGRVAQSASVLASSCVEEACARSSDRGMLGDVAKFRNRERVPLSKIERAERSGVIPYYGATGVVDFVDRPLFDEPLVLVGEDGTVVHNSGNPVVQYIWGPAWVNNHAHVLTGVGVSNPVLRHIVARSNVADRVTGAVQPKLSMGNLRSVVVEIPSSVELPSLERQVEALTSREMVAIDESRRLSSTRDELLPLLMSGKITVKDAEKTVEEVV